MSLQAPLLRQAPTTPSTTQMATEGTYASPASTGPDYNPEAKRPAAGASVGGKHLPPVAAQFKQVNIGIENENIPWEFPNASTMEDIVHIVNGAEGPESCCRPLLGSLCCFTGIGALYLCAKQNLIEQGFMGVAINNGKPEILAPGRHLLLSPLNSFVGKYSVGAAVIRTPDPVNGPISIIRVPQGQFGLAWDNSEPCILLPGLHVKTSGAFRFMECVSVDREEIRFGPVKFLTVKSGGVRVCFLNGKVQIFKEGRYAVNSGMFEIGGRINTQQQTLRFDNHNVLLDGGISLLVEGLLTYQVRDVELLIHQLGDVDLVHSIKDVTKAEIARVFATIHLEEISSAASLQKEARIPGQTDVDEKSPAVLGPAQNTGGEGETRTRICQSVMQNVKPITDGWGVYVMNFQLESTKIADEKYATEYEAASLAMAKAKANLRAVEAENRIKLQRARADAESLKIAADGKKQSQVIESQGYAEARIIEAKARNEAAQLMTDRFGRELQLAGQKVEFARALQAKVLTVLPDSMVGKPIVSQFQDFDDGKDASLGAGKR